MPDNRRRKRGEEITHRPKLPPKEAIQEFLNIRERLADYFDESQEEDVFNYIPPQETNQISHLNRL